MSDHALPPPPPVVAPPKTTPTPAPQVEAPAELTPESDRVWEEFIFRGETPVYDADGNVIDVHEWAIPMRRIAGPRRPGVPEIDPDYVFREEMVREFVWAIWPHDDGDWTPCLFAGMKGTGKTSFVLQIAARCNIVVHRANLNVGTSVRHLKGRKGAEAGRTIFVPGVATTAMEAGDWLLLDEVSGATPPVALCLFPIMEPTGAVLLEDEQPQRYVERHEDFRVMMTDNTIGAEQEEARFNYSGTNPDMNEALLDRIGSFIQVDYLKPEHEHDVVAEICAVDEDDAEMHDNIEGIVRVANHIRNSGSGISFSTRMVINWARRVCAGYVMPDGTTRLLSDREIYEAAFPAFLSKMRSRIERDAIAEVILRVFEIEEPSGDDKSIDLGENLP